MTTMLAEARARFRSALHWIGYDRRLGDLNFTQINELVSAILASNDDHIRAPAEMVGEPVEALRRLAEFARANSLADTAYDSYAHPIVTLAGDIRALLAILDKPQGVGDNEG